MSEPTSGAEMRVAVVTPSFNQAATIEKTIESVLGQDYPFIDYLVMDGGSTDGTIEILRRYEDQIRWVSQKDDGQSDAIRRGFASTQGDLVAWLNSDDAYTPHAVSLAVAAAQANPETPFVYGEAEFVSLDGRSLGSPVIAPTFDRRRMLREGNLISQPAVFMRRQALDVIGGIDASLHFGMDYDLWLRLATQGTPVYVPKVLAQIHVYPETKSSSGSFRRWEELEEVARRNGGGALPAYNRLERAAAFAGLATDALKQRRLVPALRSAAAAARDTCAMSVVAALGRRSTWRAIGARARRSRLEG